MRFFLSFFFLLSAFGSEWVGVACLLKIMIALVVHGVACSIFYSLLHRNRDPSAGLCRTQQNNPINFFAPFRSFFLGSLHPLIEYHTQGATAPLFLGRCVVRNSLYRVHPTLVRVTGTAAFGRGSFSTTNDAVCTPCTPAATDTAAGAGP